MKTGFSLWEKLHRENRIVITGMGSFLCAKQIEIGLHLNFTLNIQKDWKAKLEDAYHSVLKCS